LLADIVHLVAGHVAGRLEDYRGMFAFLDPFHAQAYTAVDFAALYQAGLNRVYVGLETGNAALRAAVHKPGDMSHLVQSIHRIKESGMSVGLIVIAGLGGREYFNAHVEETAAIIRRLPLDTADIIFVSPLAEHGENSTDAQPLMRHELLTQYQHIQRSLPQGLRSSLYDISGFIY
jgi:radical SAM superfamily enzyme YgiQ (UPF0313 family)